MNEKIDQILKSQETIINMLTDLIYQLSARQSGAAQNKQMLETYIQTLATLVQSQGGSPEFVEKFKTILGGQK